MKERIIKLLRRFRRIIIFGFVGVLNTLVDYGIFALCYELLHIPIAVSQFLGYMSGSLCGYFMNSNVTFREGKGRTKAQSLQYIGIDVVITVLSGAFMHWVERQGWPVYIIKIFVTVAVAAIHYIIYKYFVFRIGKEDSANE